MRLDLARFRSASACALMMAMIMLPWPPVSAQTLYRCGAVYQDRPCKGVDSKVVGKASAAPAETPADERVSEPVCRDRGAAAQKLMWEKESGRTLEEQLSRAGVDVDLAKRVYSRRGSSVDVRRAIETECLKEQERAAVHAEGPAVASKAPTPSNHQDGLAAPGAQQGGGGRAAVPSAAGGMGTSSGKASQCEALNAELVSLAELHRTGGSVSTMDDLRARARAAQSRKRSAGC